MFENVIRQEEPVGLLRDDLAAGRLPASLLFSGGDFSGKMTAALELARALGCETKGAPWNCGCRSCEAHRLLLNPYTALLGGRYFSQEISACLDTLKRSDTLSSRYLFLRSVRKLTRRFDPFLWEGDEQKLQKILGPLQSVEDILLDLSPPAPLPPPEKLEKAGETVLTAAGKILDAVNLDAIPVARIRRVASWAHMGAAGARKVIILENADRMLDPAKNALLKILEEPPPHVYFILLTARRGAVLPTILSRVRTYVFPDRGGEAEREVLERIFRETSGEFPSLKDFFLVFRDVNPHTLRAAALGFFKSSLGAAGPDGFLDFSRAVPEDASLFQDRAKFKLFLQELLAVLRETLRGNFHADELRKVPAGRIEEWSVLIRKSAEALEVFNLNPGLLAERLHSHLGRAG